MRNSASMTCLLLAIGVIYCDDTFTYPFQTPKLLANCYNKTFVTEDCQMACDFVARGWLVGNVIKLDKWKERAKDDKNELDKKYPWWKTCNKHFYDKYLGFLDECLGRANKAVDICKGVQVFFDCEYDSYVKVFVGRQSAQTKNELLSNTGVIYCDDTITFPSQTPKLLADCSNETFVTEDCRMACDFVARGWLVGNVMKLGKWKERAKDDKNELDKKYPWWKTCNKHFYDKYLGFLDECLGSANKAVDICKGIQVFFDCEYDSYAKVLVGRQSAQRENELLWNTGVIYCDDTFTYRFQTPKLLADCSNKTFVTEDCRKACEFVAEGWLVGNVIKLDKWKERAKNDKNELDKKYPWWKKCNKHFYDKYLGFLDECLGRANKAVNVCKGVQVFFDCEDDSYAKVLVGRQSAQRENELLSNTGVIYCDDTFTYPFQTPKLLADCYNKTFVTEDCRKACEFVAEGWLVGGVIKLDKWKERTKNDENEFYIVDPLKINCNQRFYDKYLDGLKKCLRKTDTKSHVCERAPQFDNCKDRLDSHMSTSRRIMRNRRKDCQPT